MGLFPLWISAIWDLLPSDTVEGKQEVLPVISAHPTERECVHAGVMMDNSKIHHSRGKSLWVTGSRRATPQRLRTQLRHMHTQMRCDMLTKYRRRGSAFSPEWGRITRDVRSRTGMLPPLMRESRPREVTLRGHSERNQAPSSHFRSHQSSPSESFISAAAGLCLKKKNSEMTWKWQRNPFIHTPIFQTSFWGDWDAGAYPNHCWTKVCPLDGLAAESLKKQQQLKKLQKKKKMKNVLFLSNKYFSKFVIKKLKLKD